VFKKEEGARGESTALVILKLLNKALDKIERNLVFIRSTIEDDISCKTKNNLISVGKISYSFNNMRMVKSVIVKSE